MTVTVLAALIGLLGAVNAGTSTAASSPTTYVSPTGSDAATGGPATPMRSIAAALARTPSGGTVVVAAGSYHESLTLSGRSGRTVTAAPGAQVWLDGSVPVSGWSAAGGTWVHDGWTAQFDSSPTFTSGVPDGPAPGMQFVNPAHPMAAHPDQVWVDGVPLTQVASAAQVTPGTFFVDDAADRLVLGSDPTGHLVTASDLSSAISVQEPGDTISGINVRAYATPVPRLGAVTVWSLNDTFANAQVVDNATTGLFVTGAGNRVLNTTLARNGLLGLASNRAASLTLDGLTVSGNNQQQFNPVPAAGGAKLSRATDVTVRRSTFQDNFGTGLWFDLQSYGMHVVSNRFLGNSLHGLFLEVSGTATVAGNVVNGNTGDGVRITDTDRVQVWNNTVASNGRGIDILQDSRDRTTPAADKRGLPLSLRSRVIGIHNNVIGRPASAQDCELCVEDWTQRFSARQLRIKVNGNVYQHPTAGRSRWLVVWSRGRGNPAVFHTLKVFRAAAHQERRGKVLARVSGLRGGSRWLVTTTAVPLPRSVANQVGTRPGRKHLGAWRAS